MENNAKLLEEFDPGASLGVMGDDAEMLVQDGLYRAFAVWTAVKHSGRAAKVVARDDNSHRYSVHIRYDDEPAGKPIRGSKT